MSENKINNVSFKRNFWLDFSTGLAIAVGLGVIIILFIGPWTNFTFERVLNKRIQTLERNMENLDNLTQEVRLFLDNNEDVSEAILAIGIRDKLDKIDEKLELYDELFLVDNPEHIVAIPLLVKDINTVKADNMQMQTQLSSLSNQMRWFIGIFLTQSLAFIALAIGSKKLKE